MVVAIIAIFISVIKSRLGAEYTFLKYLYFSILLTLFTGSSAFGDSGSIVTLCITFYVIEITKHNLLVNNEQENEPSDYSEPGEKETLLE